MKRRIWRGCILVLAAAVLLSMGGCAVSSDETTGTIELINSSVVTIDGFYLAAVDQRSWGPNILAGPLFPGQNTFIVDIVEGYYDARIRATGVYSDYFGYLYDIPVTAGGLFPLYVYNSSFTGSLEIRNSTLGANIIGVYVVPRAAATWGVNQASSVIRPGGSLHLIDFVPALYDVRIVWNIGPDSIYYDIRISSLALTTVNAN